MQDGWDKFWNFIGVAFWVVLLGWFGISSIKSSEANSAPYESAHSNTEDASDTHSSTDSYGDNDSYYEEDPEPSYYRSTYSSSYDMDCNDFDTWDDAQYYYENIADDNLDGDDDGIACEGLN